MAYYINSILEFVAQHASLTYVVVFWVCFLESLVLVGLIIPGSILLVGLGALLSTHVISFALSLSIAVIGAILGDFASYWLGRHYHRQIEQLWPFRKYPHLLEQGKIFFLCHGGKSVFLGRFVHFVRPMVPLVAGMMNMSQWRFFIFNALSAIGWVVLYLLPGFWLGGTLASKEKVVAHLSYLMGIVALVLWLVVWVVSQVFAWLSRLPHNQKVLVLKLTTVFFLLLWLFFSVTRSLMPLEALNRADVLVYRFFWQLRTHLGDQIFIALTELCDTYVNVMVIAFILTVLLYHGKFRAALYWTLVAFGSLLLVHVCKWTFQTARPTDIYDGISRFSFPSGHATTGAVLYGFLAMMLMSSFSARFRLLPLSVAVGFCLLISFSRIYLGAHWLTDVLGGLTLGFTWITLIGIFYFRKRDELPIRSLLVAVFLALFLGGSWNIISQHTKDVKRYQKGSMSLENP